MRMRGKACGNRHFGQYFRTKTFSLLQKLVNWKNVIFVSSVFSHGTVHCTIYALDMLQSVLLVRDNVFVALSSLRKL